MRSCVGDAVGVLFWRSCEGSW